jgi:hypothetical protein
MPSVYRRLDCDAKPTELELRLPDRASTQGFVEFAGSRAGSEDGDGKGADALLGQPLGHDADQPPSDSLPLEDVEHVENPQPALVARYPLRRLRLRESQTVRHGQFRGGNMDGQFCFGGGESNTVDGVPGVAIWFRFSNP